MSLRGVIVSILLCMTVLLGISDPARAAEPDWAAPAGEPDPGAAVRQVFVHYCAACHAGGDGAGAETVNFLNPASGTPADAIAHCAERIAFRLVLWDWPAVLRPLAPMPPADWLADQGLDPDAWAAGEARALLRIYMSGLLALTGSSTVRVEQTGSRDPAGLPPCLAEDAP